MYRLRHYFAEKSSFFVLGNQVYPFCFTYECRKKITGSKALVKVIRLGDGSLRKKKTQLMYKISIYFYNES